MISFSKGHIKAGFETVRSAKLRSFWTMLGVIIGVSSVITVVSIGQGVKHQIGNQLQRYDKNLITVRPAQLKTTSDSGNIGLNTLSGLSVSAPLSRKDVATVASTKGVDASAPLTIASGAVTSDVGANRDAIVLGTSHQLSSLLNQSMAYGTFWTEDDADANTAVLGQAAIDKMFETDVPLGYRFTFRGEEFIVRGIFNTFATTPLNQQADFNNAIFIPNNVAERLTKDNAATYTILVRPTIASQTDQVAQDVRQGLAASRGSSDDVEVLTGQEVLDSSNSILDLMTRLIAGVAAISLFVAGVGIMNVMLVSVAERVHEIGIRKAVGATNRQIMSQFLIESSVLTVVGGTIGILLAYLINGGLRLATNLKPEITWEIVVIASGVSLLVGVVFGTVPAIKAARKSPIEALRAE